MFWTVEKRKHKEFRTRIIRSSHGWKQSNIFSRCHCGGLRIKGICQSCGWASVCSYCGRVRQADGSYLPVKGDFSSASHGICHDCLVRELPHIWDWIGTEN